MFFSKMTQKKAADSKYAYWPLIEEPVRDFIEAWPEPFSDPEQVLGWMRGPLLEAAVDPTALTRNRAVKDACAEIYSKHPDFFLAAMVRLRQVDGGKFGMESQVHRWLMLNPTVNIMNQNFPLNRLDQATLSRLFKRDTGMDMTGLELKELVDKYQAR